MLARKCDRCRQFYDDYDRLVVDEKKVTANSVILCCNSTINGNLNRVQYDLCPNCMTELIRYIGGEAEIVSKEE